MNNISAIYISTDLFDETVMAHYFAQHDATQYRGTLDEAREELAHWLNPEIAFATATPTDENTEEVTVEVMRELIREHVLSGHLTVATEAELIRNGFTSGDLVDAGTGEVIEEGEFSFEAHDDLVEWERLADIELSREGFVRLGDWWEEGGTTKARVALKNELD